MLIFGIFWKFKYVYKYGLWYLVSVNFWYLIFISGFGSMIFDNRKIERESRNFMIGNEVNESFDVIIDNLIEWGFFVVWSKLVNLIKYFYFLCMLVKYREREKEYFVKLFVEKYIKFFSLYCCEIL